MIETSDWKLARIDEIGSIITGSTPPTTDRTNYGTDYLFISPADLGTRKYISTSAKMLSQKGFSRSRSVPRGSTMFVCIGSTIGKVGLAARNLATNQQINSIVPSSRVDGEFLYYAATALSEVVRRQAGEQAVPLVNKSEFGEFQILLPPLTEQVEIASSLSAADQLISTLERVIAKKQAVKTGMMQELLLGKTRLPGHSERWESVTLGESGEISGGGVDKRTVDGEQAVTLINYLDVYRNEFVESNTAIQEVTASPRKVITCQVRKGDVLFTPTSETPDDIARSAVVQSETPNTVYSYHLVRWRPNGEWDVNFLGFMFSHQAFRSQVTELAAGSGTRYVVSMPGFRSLQVMRPPLEEQRDIGLALRSIADEIEVLTKQLVKAQALRRGMMQQLLTGRTRLSPEKIS